MGETEVEETLAGLDDPCVWREVEIKATPDEVWEALATEAGRDAWLEPDPGRWLEVAESDPPNRLVWWWSQGDEEPRRVELIVVGVPAGSRVIVIESAPTLPLSMLAASCTQTFALA
jgi:uncharacterized protein YndB with AHSA1/START domain